MSLNFHKYHAFGNDMLVLDPASFTLPLSAAVIRLLCHRHFGPGADGICYGPLPGGPPWRMRFFNPDGSESGKSGNGLRIFARYLWEHGYAGTTQFQITIGADTVDAAIEDTAARTITTGMGQLSFQSPDIPLAGPPRAAVNESLEIGGQVWRFTGVSIGNPHCVIFGENISAETARQAGPLIETHPLFPQRTNVQWARVVDEHTLEIQIWERGAGYTLASGSSASAAAGAAVKTGRCASPVQVRMPGGAARVVIAPDWPVTLTGEVEAVCRGALAPDLVERLRQG